MAQEGKHQPVIRWQRPNIAVLYTLIGPCIASVYFFGWRSLFLLAAVTLTGFITEYTFLRLSYQEPVSSAVFVSCILFTLTLPPTIPTWIALIGIVFGIAIGKMAFGGFGRNIFNPALVGRAFIYISFGAPMTARWVESANGFPGGFSLFHINSITTATPLAKLAQGASINYSSLILGNISGCMGETSAIIILLGGLYIVYRKFANYRIVLSGILGMLLLQSTLWAFRIHHAINPLGAILSGGFLLGIFFMATDPVSASQTNTGRWIYGGIIGIITVLIRTFAIWSEGMMFAILLGNMFAPIIDYYIRQSKSKRPS